MKRWLVVVTWQERRSVSGIGSQVLVSTSWDGDREEYDMVPLYVLWNAPGKLNESFVLALEFAQMKWSTATSRNSQKTDLQLNRCVAGASG